MKQGCMCVLGITAYIVLSVYPLCIVHTVAHEISIYAV